MTIEQMLMQMNAAAVKNSTQAPKKNATKAHKKH
jgi:hypothetical protein